MQTTITLNDFEIIKDGCIISEQDDNINFPFGNMTISFRIVIKDEVHKELEITPDSSNNKLTFVIPIEWNSLNTTFSKKLEVGTFTEGGERKDLYISYAVTGLAGSFKTSLFRYTWFTKVQESNEKPD